MVFQTLVKTRRSSRILCGLGILVCVYAYHVEHMKAKNDEYVAFCDLHEKISCTKAFSTRYGRGFGLLELVVGEESVLNQPNSVFGIAFYILQIYLDQKNSADVARFQIFLSIIANIGSVYLACLLIFVLRTMCVVCILTYVLNAILLICNVKKFLILRAKVK